MEDTIRIIWVSDAVAATGFSRVSHSILNELAKSEQFEILMLGVNYFGDPHDYNYKIFPASVGGDLMGFKRLKPMVEYYKPDVVFILNDIWVIDQYFDILPKDVPIISYSPIDAGPLKRQWLRRLYERLTFMVVYTGYAYNMVTTQYPLLKPIVIPHGVDFDLFYPLEGDYRNELSIEKDWWVVLNAHRNQPRKKIDSTIRAFTEFAKDKPKNVKLYLHMGLKDMGWDIQDLWERSGIEERIVITNPLLSPQNPVSDETLNIMYNSCDIGINTSYGEGWGLPNFEHAAVKRAQIVPNSSACAELFADDRGLLIDVYDQPITHTGSINTDGALIKESSLVEKLQWAYEHPEECSQMAERMYEYMCQPQFQWSAIAEQFAKLLVAAAKSRSLTTASLELDKK